MNTQTWKRPLLWLFAVCVMYTQELCYTQTFPPWSVMTLDTPRHHTESAMSHRASAAASAGGHDDDVIRDDDDERILVRKGCVARSVTAHWVRAKILAVFTAYVEFVSGWQHARN